MTTALPSDTTPGNVTLARAQSASDQSGDVSLHSIIADELYHYKASEGSRSGSQVSPSSCGLGRRRFWRRQSTNCPPMPSSMEP